MIKHLGLLLLLGLFFTACENYEQLEEHEIINEPKVEVESKFGGQITNANGLPLESVIVKIKDQYIETDKNGLFLSPLDFYNSTGEIFHILSADEILYSYSVIPAVNDIAYTPVILPDPTKYLVRNDEASSIDEFPWQIEIPQHTINTVIPTNDYHLYFKNFSLENHTEIDMIPNALVDLENEGSAYLIVKKAFHIAGRSLSGDFLDFNEKGAIQVKFDPADFSDNTDCFYFDKNSGRWNLVKSDHIDLSSGNIEINRFGYYAFGETVGYSKVTSAIKLADSGLSNIKISLSDANTGQQYHPIYSQQSGKLSFIAPLNYYLRLTVLSACNEILHEQDILPKQEQEALDEIELNESMFYAWQGVLRNCDDEKLASGALLWKGESNTGYQFINGSAMHIFTSKCGSSVTSFKGVDLINRESGPWYKWEEFSDNSNELYSVFACNEASPGYIRFRINGEAKIYWDPYFSVENGQTAISFEDQNPISTEIRIFFRGLTKGKYDDTLTNIFFKDPDFGEKGYEINCPTSTLGCGFEDFFIGHYVNNANTNIKGKFDAEFWMLSYYPLKAEYIPSTAEFQVLQTR